MKIVTNVEMAALSMSLMFLAVLKHASSHGDHKVPAIVRNQEIGRIQEFDTLVLLNIESMMNKKFMSTIVAEGEALAHSLLGTVDEEMAKYYLELLKLAEKDGLESLKGERDRINAIFSSHNPSAGMGELEYAVKRRNVLDWFSEANAQIIMGNLNMENEMGGIEEL